MLSYRVNVWANETGAVEVEPKANTYHWPLEELQEIVEGTIEVLSGFNFLINQVPYIMIVDEEGNLNEKPFNPMASRLANRAIVGTALLIPAWSLV